MDLAVNIPRRHIKNFHKMLGAHGVMCIRCRELFPTAGELRAHMLLPVEELCEPMVSIPPRNPEDGITPEMEDVLNGRKMDLKIATWHDLWRLHFLKDSTIPEAGESPACRCVLLSVRQLTATRL